MTNLLLIMVLSSNLVTWWFLYGVSEELHALQGRTAKQVIRATPTVTSTNPALVNQDASNQDESAIITPKSPALIDFEEQEQIRKLNLRPQ